MKTSDAFASLRQHLPFALIAVIAAGLIFTNLGSDYLWADEGDTAVLASNILKFGVPKAWDGVTFMDSDFGARENEQLVMVSSPWVQYYVTAASFLVFGQNTFAARFPFALAGWMSILLGYFIVWQITVNRWAAFFAAVLLSLSVQFLLYSRQSRYYALSMLVTCLLIWTFFQMKSFRESVLFAVLAILLFHIHPIGIVPVGVLAILTLLHRPFAAQRPWLWLALPGIVAFTIPWFAFARTGYTESAVLVPSIRDFFARFAQYLIECASVTPLVGIVVLSVVLWSQWRLGIRLLSCRERDFACHRGGDSFLRGHHGTDSAQRRSLGHGCSVHFRNHPSGCNGRRHFGCECRSPQSVRLGVAPPRFCVYKFSSNYTMGSLGG